MVTVGAPGGPQVTGTILDPNGVPLEGVLVGNGDLNSTNYIGGYTDSHGRYTLVNVPEALTINAYQFGCTFSNVLNLAFPLDVTNTSRGIDFVGYPLPAVSVVADTNTVAENDGTLHHFTVTRTGDGSNDLTVQINLSGTAIDGSDYTLTPDLASVSTLLDSRRQQQREFHFQNR